MINQKILPAISSAKKFEAFMRSDLMYCILMDLTLEQAELLIKAAHKGGKKCIVHIDLIKGIKNDEYGSLYMCHRLEVDGLISVHPPAIATAKKKGKIAIQRVFLIDSRSLEKSINVANNTRPDYLELLPALAYDAVERITAKVDIPIISGGLIRDKDDITRCLDVGVVAVTTSKEELWHVTY